MSRKKSEEGNNVGGWEKWSYALYFFGQNIIYALIALNVQTLFSDVGITAATVAAILLVTKLWDAINDPLLGIIIDRVQFKKGRFLPWLRISLPFIALSSIFLFALPSGASMGIKICWAIIGYVAWDMSYTVCDVPIFVLPTSMTDNIKERSSILSLGRYLGIVGLMAGSVMLPVLQTRLGWFGIGILLSIVGAAFMLPLCFSAKERHIVRSEQGVTLQQMGRYVAGNKYLLIFFIAVFASSVTNFASTLSLFFARYNLGNQDLASILGMLTIVPTIVVGAFIPSLIKKVDKYYMYVVFMIISAVICLARFFIGYENLTVFIAFAAVHGMVMGTGSIVSSMFMPDCLEYGTYHTGERAEGVAASVQTFVNKLTGSISGPIAMLLIGAFGFVAGENAVQPASALSGIWLGITIFPFIGTVIALVLLWFYKLRDKDVQIMARYNTGKISKEEAEALLSTKYGPAVDLVKMTLSHNG